MFRIITLNGVELGLTDKPRYISKGASGSYVEVEKEKARGISYKGTIYNLVGKPSIGGTETVIVVGSSNAEEFERQEEKARARQSIADIAFVVAVEEEKIDDTSALEHAEVFAEWATNVNYKSAMYVDIKSCYIAAYKPTLRKQAGRQMSQPRFGKQSATPEKSILNGHNRLGRSMPIISETRSRTTAQNGTLR